MVRWQGGGADGEYSAMDFVDSKTPLWVISFRGSAMNCRALLLAAAVSSCLHAQSIPGISAPTVPGLPFTAKMNLQWTHQVNGSFSTGMLVSTIARDSQGRVHIEGHDFSVGTPDPQASLNSTTVTDPIAKTSITCDTRSRICHIWPCIPLRPDQIADPFGLDALSRTGGHTRTTPDGKKVVQAEPLPMETIAGLPASGVRTTTFPAAANGSAIEDPALKAVTDTWISRDRGLIVAQLRHFPGGEIQAVELSDIQQGDPDASLFTLPSGYEMKDERKAGAVLPPTVTPPVVVRQVNPQLSDEARQHRPLDATVLVGLVVDVHGDPQQVHVVRGFGEGLDEQAVKAVEQYRFRPAMKDGQAVATALNVSVRFQIF
jgi:TonB family protein